MKVIVRWLSVVLAAGVCIIAASCAPSFKKYRIDLGLFYADKSVVASDIVKGKHIVGFFNPDCKHCTEAALAMHRIRQENPSIPFFMFVFCSNTNTQDSAIVEKFWKETQALDVPHACLDFEAFSKHTNGAFPQILWVNDGWVEARTDNNPVNRQAIEKWLRQN